MSHFVCFGVVDAQWMLRLVVSQQNLITVDVDCLSADVIAKKLFDGRFDSYVPEVDRAVPTST